MKNIKVIVSHFIENIAWKESFMKDHWIATWIQRHRSYNKNAEVHMYSQALNGGS